MDILYCLGEGSKWNNNEIKYSLRSIEKFGKNVGNIYIVGYNSGFFSDKVTFINYPNHYDRKQKNILDAIFYAVDNSNIGESFLYSSDDHFYVKDVDFEKYPYYCKGILPNKLFGKNKFSKYFLSLLTTRKILEKYGFTYYNFSQHGNTHFTREGIKQSHKLIKESLCTRYGVEPTCLILNVIYSYNKFPIINREDLKLGEEIKCKDDLIKFIDDREVFSISDISIKNGVEEYLNELFPIKSKYEK